MAISESSRGSEVTKDEALEQLDQIVGPINERIQNGEKVEEYEVETWIHAYCAQAGWVALDSSDIDREQLAKKMHEAADFIGEVGAGDDE